MADLVEVDSRSSDLQADQSGSGADQQGIPTIHDALRSAPKRQKTGGAHLGSHWAFFIRSTEKRNSSHYDATCRACSEAGK